MNSTFTNLSMADNITKIKNLEIKYFYLTQDLVGKLSPYPTQTNNWDVG